MPLVEDAASAQIISREPDRAAQLSAGLRRRTLLLILLVALAVRLLALAAGKFGVAADTWAFARPAQALLDGDVAGWFYKNLKPPLFPAVVALPAAVANGLGASWVLSDKSLTRAGATIIQCLSLLAGLWTLHPAWLLLRRFGEDRAALAGLAFVAVMPLMVSLSARGLSDTTYSVIFLYAANLLLSGVARLSVGRLVVAGLLGGLCFLTRSEALMWIPIAGGLLLIGAIVRRLTWRFAAAGLFGFALPVLMLAAPYVALVSKAEGRFTIRRNAGQFLAKSAGLEEKRMVTSGPGRSESEMLTRQLGDVLAAWPKHFAAYFYNMTTRSMGYVGAVFLIVGLLVSHRELARWGPLLWAMLIYLLGVAQLSVIEPHSRFLSGLIVLLAWPMGVGAVAIAESIVRWNPAKMAEPRKAFRWIMAGLVAVVLIPTLAHVRPDKGSEESRHPTTRSQ